MKKFVSGDLTCRVLRFSEAPDTSDLIERASAIGNVGDIALSAMFCADSPPFSPELDRSRGELSYGSPFSCLWIRIDEVKVTQAAVKQHVSDVHRAVPILAMRPIDRQKALEEARRSLMEDAVPKTAIVPVLIGDCTAVVASRSVHPIVVELLTLLFGATPEQSFQFAPHGFQEVCLSIFNRCMGSEKGFEAPYFNVVVGKGVLRGPFRSISSALSAAIPEQDLLFKEVAVTVHSGVRKMTVFFDERGPYKFKVPNSAGGLPADQVSRRLSDILLATSMAHDCLQRSVLVDG